MVRLQIGDDEAAQRVFERFGQRLIALARSRLDGRVRQKVDPEDVIQSVWKSFFLRQAQGQFDLRDWDSLWTILTLITVRKCGRWREHFQAGMRDVAVEVRAWEVLDREPSPEEAAVLTETVEQVMRGLEGPQRDVVLLSLQGHTVAEVSTAVGRTRRTVQRVLREVRQRLEQLRAQD
jgi:RNA polymerase sigma-70 factor (ECF subfamily)